MIFKRKIYSVLKQWKEESDGQTALLVEGARRVGKSTVVEEFAKNEYESYILIDFAAASQFVKDLFQDISDLNYIFLQLQLQYRVISPLQSGSPTRPATYSTNKEKQSVTTNCNHDEKSLNRRRISRLCSYRRRSKRHRATHFPRQLDNRLRRRSHNSIEGTFFLPEYA